MSKIPDFGKKQDKYTHNFNPLAVYENLNKLPLIVGDYRVAMMRKLRETFIDQLNKASKEEIEYCKKHGMTPAMVGDTKKYVEDLVVRCHTLFEIEALARFVFDDNEIPTYQKIKTRAMLLEGAFPVKLKI